MEPVLLTKNVTFFPFFQNFDLEKFFCKIWYWDLNNLVLYIVLTFGCEKLKKNQASCICKTSDCVRFLS